MGKTTQTNSKTRLVKKTIKRGNLTDSAILHTHKPAEALTGGHPPLARKAPVKTEEPEAIKEWLRAGDASLTALSRVMPGSKP
jgi:hypothetical protein